MVCGKEMYVLVGKYKRRRRWDIRNGTAENTSWFFLKWWCLAYNIMKCSSKAVALSQKISRCVFSDSAPTKEEIMLDHSEALRYLLLKTFDAEVIIYG